MCATFCHSELALTDCRGLAYIWSDARIFDSFFSRWACWPSFPSASGGRLPRQKTSFGRNVMTTTLKGASAPSVPFHKSQYVKSTAFSGHMAKFAELAPKNHILLHTFIMYSTLPIEELFRQQHAVKNA